MTTALQLAPVRAPDALGFAESSTDPTADVVAALCQRNAGLLAELDGVQDLERVLGMQAEASALGALARAARVGLEQQNQLAATRVRVAHLAGRLLRRLASEPRPGRAKRARGKGPLRPQLPRGVLRQYGVTGQESSQWQSLASLPLDEVVRRMDELQVAGQEITAAEFYRRGRASLRKRSSRLAASPAELRLRAALTNLMRIRTLSTRAERELASRIAQRLCDWGVPVPTSSATRADLATVVATCLSCGREPRGSTARCACGGAWVSTLR